jgi:hypothetical protein
VTGTSVLRYTGVACVVVSAAVVFAATVFAANEPDHNAPKPTVVLVHEAFADASNWSLVATRDNAIGTANVRAMARHAHAHIQGVEASHAVMLSQPESVVRLIQAAANGED